MATPHPTALPLLIVVTGRPGSGKTTLAHSLAKEVHCPAICRDEIREGLVNTVGKPETFDDEINQSINHVFFDVVALLLNHHVTLIAEGAFQHKVWSPHLEPLMDIARLRIVLCDIEPEVASARHVERRRLDPSRDQFHDDAAYQARQHHGYEPPQLNVPTLNVDTSGDYQPPLDQIVTFVRAHDLSA